MTAGTPQPPPPLYFPFISSCTGNIYFLLLELERCVEVKRTWRFYLNAQSTFRWSDPRLNSCRPHPTPHPCAPPRGLNRCTNIPASNVKYRIWREGFGTRLDGGVSGEIGARPGLCDPDIKGPCLYHSCCLFVSHPTPPTPHWKLFPSFMYCSMLLSFLLSTQLFFFTNILRA